jgi:hypothetical protein
MLGGDPRLHGASARRLQLPDRQPLAGIRHGHGEVIPLKVQREYAMPVHERLGHGGAHLVGQRHEAGGIGERDAEHLGQGLAQGGLVDVAEALEVAEQTAAEEALGAARFHELAARDPTLGEEDLGHSLPDHVVLDV